MDQVSGMKETSPLNYISVNGVKFWTDEGREIVVEKYKAGKSLSLIAEELHTTLGSIAGLVSRARKKNLLPPASGRKPKEKLVKQKPKKGTDPLSLKFKKATSVQLTNRVRLKVVDSQTAVTFEELKAHHCRFPLGDPRQSDFRYCGKNRRDDTTYYCDEHYDLSYK